MGTKVQRESCFPAHHLMTNLEKDPNNCSWPLFYGDHTLANSQQHNGCLPSSMADSVLTYDKDVLKKTMLKHEAVFKSQIYELHHIYRIQRSLMDDLRRKESNRSRTAVEASFSSNPLASQITCEDARRSRIPSNPVCARTPISGVEDINHFILNSKKGSSCQLRPSQNGYGMKDVEALDNRSAKVRRKLIDLHLPADSYIDTDETTDAVCGRSNGNSTKEAQGDSLRPGSGLRSRNCLADLNEPFEIEETNAFASGYPQVSCNREIRGFKKIDGRKTEKLLNSLHDKEPLPMSFPHLDNNRCRRGWPPHVLGTGNYKGSQKSASLLLHPEKSSHSSRSIQVLSNNVHQHRASDTNASDTCSWKEREFIDLEANTKNGGIIHENHAEDPNNCLAWKSVSAQRHPILNSPEILSDNAQRVGCLGDTMHSENISKMNSVVSSLCSNQKGFDNGSASFSREYPPNCPSIGNNYQNGRNDSAISPKNVKNHFLKDLNRWERKTVRNLNLNVEFSNDLVDEARNIGEQRCSLPCLQPKPSCKGETIRQRDRNASSSSVLSSSMTNPDDSVKTPNLKSACYSNNVELRKIDANDCSASKKVLGCTISPNVDLKRVLDINLPFEPAFLVPEEDLSIDSRADTDIPASFRRQIDLNLSVCDDEDSLRLLTASSDVNVPVIDLEIPAVHEVEEFDVCGENSPESSYEKANNKTLDEIVQMAAEAIVAFSSSVHDSGSDEVACSSQQASVNFLHLFAETINSYGEDLDEKLEAGSINEGNRNNKDLSSIEEIDYFESMILKLNEMKEEEYMPKPMIPRNLELDETGPSFLPSQRPRRGNARRGRPRRDFQHDILPGLASLARHEATEDIQTFGGLMRATGYDWNAGLARKKSGSKRGRPRLLMVNPNPSIPSPRNPVYPSPRPQQLNNNINHCTNVEKGLEDRSITGWGNMTRRPRRQRCPAGNNRTHVSLT